MCAYETESLVKILPPNDNILSVNCYQHTQSAVATAAAAGRIAAVELGGQVCPLDRLATSSIDTGQINAKKETNITVQKFSRKPCLHVSGI